MFQKKDDNDENDTFGNFFCVAGEVLGSFLGAELGAAGAQYVVEQTCNSYEYGINKKKCLMCNEQFIIRKYKGEMDKDYCNDCQN